MINYSELRRGVKIILNGQPHEILESSSMFKGRGGSLLRAKIKNLITGNITSKTFHPADSFEEAEIKRLEAKFLYSHRDKFVFCEKDNSAERFELIKEQIGQQADFLKQNQIIEGSIFKKEVINISLPIKINFKVIEAPPGIKGNRAEAGTKLVILETGAKINVPLFIKEDDIIEVNTQTGEYSKRVEEDKSSS